MATDYVQLDHTRHTGSQTSFKRVGLYQPIARRVYEKEVYYGTTSCQDISSILAVQFYRVLYQGGGYHHCAINIFHYKFLISIEHDTKEQFECAQVKNKIFQLISIGEKGYSCHRMGYCLVYYICVDHWKRLIATKKVGYEPWENLIIHRSQNAPPNWEK